MKYPKSVQTGIPKLTSKKIPKWSLTKMGAVFDTVERPAKIKDKEKYTLVTVKRSRGGIEKRGELFGKQIKTKAQFFVKTGDFLISRRQIVHGACAIVSEGLDGAVVSNEYLVLIPRKNFDLNYLRFYSYSIYFQQTCFHASIGIHVEKMVFKPHWWFKFKHIFPPLPEQKKIAAILSAWDKAIEKSEKLIEAKLKLKKGLMQKLLTGKVRFKEFIKPAKRIGKLPENWKIVELGSIFEERNEKGYNDLPLLSITGDRGVVPFNEIDKKDSSNEDKSKYKRILPGDIGYNTMRMWQGRSALSSLEGIVSPAYTICKPKESINGLYASYLFKTSFVINQFYRNSQGLTSDNWNLKYHNFSRIKIIIPEVKEQKRIASVLSIADKEIELLNKKLEAVKQQKKGLMQKLLTGEVRVKIPSASGSSPLLKGSH